MTVGMSYIMQHTIERCVFGGALPHKPLPPLLGSQCERTLQRSDWNFNPSLETYIGTFSSHGSGVSARVCAVTVCGEYKSFQAVFNCCVHVLFLNILFVLVF